jgi:uncharacterized membrane protein YgdD (TMEM256/DUF423 family)
MNTSTVPFHTGTSMQAAGTGALLMALGVAAGALGAHGLATRLDEQHLHVFETAVRYQLFHALGLLAIGLAPLPAGAVKLPATLLVAGVVLFCGSLYALAFGGPVWLGPVTPLGGLCLILGWAWLAYALYSRE